MAKAGTMSFLLVSLLRDFHFDVHECWVRSLRRAGSNREITIKHWKARPTTHKNIFLESQRQLFWGYGVSTLSYFQVQWPVVSWLLAGMPWRTQPELVRSCGPSRQQHAAHRRVKKFISIQGLPTENTNAKIILTGSS